MSNAGFLRCLAFTLLEEGGARFTDDPRDPGAATRWGITLATLQAWRHDSALGADAVRNLSQDEATAIYGTDYWARVAGDRLPCGVDLMVFDFGVTSGPARSARMLQTALGIGDADGWIGDATLAIADAQNATDIIPALWNAQRDFYAGLQNADVFGRGWLSRTARRRDDALAMVRPVSDAVA